MTSHSPSLEFFKDIQGSFDRAAPLGQLHRPKSVDVAGDLLVFHFGSWEEQEYVDPPPDLLDRFRTLADRSPEEIRALAHETGILGVCRNGGILHPSLTRNCEGLATIPSYPRPLSSPERDLPRQVIPPKGQSWILNRDLCVNEEPDLPWCWGPVDQPDLFTRLEPLVAWRAYAAFAENVLRLAVDTHTRRMQVPRGVLDRDPLYWDWKRLIPDAGEAPSPALLCLYLEFLIHKWLQWGDVRPELRWQWPDWPIVELRGNHLFGALATRLLLAVAKADALLPCVECGNLFTPRRWPRDDERHFCDRCAEQGARQRYAKRDQRKRDRLRLQLQEMLSAVRERHDDYDQLVAALIAEGRQREPSLPEEQIRRVAEEVLNPDSVQRGRGRKSKRQT